jgi:hypothetical protein
LARHEAAGHCLADREDGLVVDQQLDGVSGSFFDPGQHRAVCRA